MIRSSLVSATGFDTVPRPWAGVVAAGLLILFLAPAAGMAQPRAALAGSPVAAGSGAQPRAALGDKAVPAGGAGQPRAVPSLAKVLDAIGKEVESFWNYIPGVTCTEVLTQEKLGDKGKVLFREHSSYDYLVLLQSAGGDIAVDESRIEKSHKESKAKAPLLTTSGFSILELIFHPMYQSDYEFTQLPDDVVSDKHSLRIGFRQIDKTHSPSVLALRGREYPLLWKGTAWVDPATFAVERIDTGLTSPMEDIGLLELDAHVTYSTVHFGGAAPATYWLPARAVVEAATKRQHWRNTDLFSDYRRFDVQTEVKASTAR